MNNVATTPSLTTHTYRLLQGTYAVLVEYGIDPNNYADSMTPGKRPPVFDSVSTRYGCGSERCGLLPETQPPGTVPSHLCVVRTGEKCLHDVTIYVPLQKLCPLSAWRRQIHGEHISPSCPYWHSKTSPREIGPFPTFGTVEIELFEVEFNYATGEEWGGEGLNKTLLEIMRRGRRPTNFAEFVALAGTHSRLIDETRLTGATFAAGGTIMSRHPQDHDSFTNVATACRDNCGRRLLLQDSRGVGRQKFVFPVIKL